MSPQREVLGFSKYELSLNPPQREAVLHREGPLLVLAGAGSGKTRVITHRIANLVAEGVAPRTVLAVTFTNKAAGEMKERVERLLSGATRGLWIGTFHAICARLLRIYGEHVGISPGYVIYDTTDQRSLMNKILKDMRLPERMFAPREILGRIDRAKNEGVGPDEYQGGDFFTDLVADVYPEYQRRLRGANAVDFGDLLLNVVKLLRIHPELVDELATRFRFLLVDEFQDTNSVQYEFIRQISKEHKNLCVVGDDDQSIYGWRGADIRNILNFERDYPGAKVVKLEQNYRSTQVILDAAFAVISRNEGRKEKRLWTERDGGDLIQYSRVADEKEEATFVVQTLQNLRRTENRGFADFAIFYRTHAQSRVIEDALRAAVPAIPYAVVGGMRFYDRAEVKDLLAYLKLIINPRDDVSLFRIFNVPTRGIGHSTIKKIADRAKELGVSVLEAARRCVDDSSDSKDILGNSPKIKVRSFCQLIDDFVEASKTVSLFDLSQTILEKTGYMERLAIDGSIEARIKAENLMELLASIQDYESGFLSQLGKREKDPLFDGEAKEVPILVGYLEQVSLATSEDSYAESEGQVTLMTVHSAKGLEFPVVFICGLEQGVFPHSRSMNYVEKMEEERRLAYVAITRAKERLFLSNAQQRWYLGTTQVNDASEFIDDIPPELLKMKAPVVSLGGQALGRSAGRTKRDVWGDYSFDQSAPDSGESQLIEYEIGMAVEHKKFGVGEIRCITGSAPNFNLTIYFQKIGPRTIRSNYVTVV
ncbi:MAG: UvrD-helicase domain-containing protein [Pseudomonadota bacterium]